MPAPPKGPAKPIQAFTLKKQLHTPSDHLGDYTLLFVGEKKTGKTSLAIQFPDHFVLQFEPGNTDHLEGCYFQDIHNWEEAKAAVTFLQKNPDFCQTLVIDDIPSVYEYCLREVRRYLKLAENEKPGWTGYDVCKRWFDEWVRQVEGLPSGKIYTAHTKLTDATTRTGRTISQLEPSWTGQCKTVLDKYVKLTGYIVMNDDGSRELQIIGDDFIKANNGFDTHFLLNGKQMKSIPLGKSAQEGYQNLIRAWNNNHQPKKQQQPQQTKTTPNNGGQQKKKTVSLDDL
ncbi:MAG: AAA family ATPase [Candidatus Dadabacteria bacterium]|nr:AAA family ATPase [Candidatus Dadabacteria bacterium]